MKFIDKFDRRLVLGLTGVAGAGKDTFYKILQREIRIKRYSLADILKEEVKEDCIAKYNIDPTSCSRAEKEDIRDYLVEYGAKKREETNGRYFVDKLHKKICDESGGVKENVCITDIRYAEYSKDEAHWIQNELGGYLVHVQKYKQVPFETFKELNEPANESEAFNNPKLMGLYDFLIEWEHHFINTELELDRHLKPFIKNFLECLRIKLEEDNIRINLQ